MSPSASGKPLLVYDGDCAFCTDWVRRLQSLTGDSVAYAPFQDAPQQAVQLVLPGGEVHRGARAVFEALACGGLRGWLWAYKRVPGFAPISEWIYRLIARHRGGRRS